MLDALPKLSIKGIISEEISQEVSYLKLDQEEKENQNIFTLNSHKKKDNQEENIVKDDCK